MKRKTVRRPPGLGDVLIQKRKAKMPASPNTEHTIEVTVKASQLFASLYMTKLILDSETITSVVFDNSVRGIDVKENPDIGVPMKITIKKVST